MSIYIDKLKKCNTISDFIDEFNLGLSVKQFGYIVYGLTDDKKYQPFNIPKATGGSRLIYAPKKSLKFLQKQFADIFLQCILDIQNQNPQYLKCNHAFEKHKSIISNAQLHQKKRYILNIDLSDFFGSIHYGRIKGFLVNDKYFGMSESGARIIAKLATCHQKLPQGSPLSPILASLIGNTLDIRLVKLAKKYKLTYTRYADDITLSSNIDFRKNFVDWDEIESMWVVNPNLEKTINKSGFSINPQKTRYVTFHSRQVVTGLVVNKHTNVSSEYKKQNRAMVDSLLKTGSFYILKNNEKTKGNINQLIGRLNYTVYAKYYQPIIATHLLPEERENIKKANKNHLTKTINSSWQKNKKDTSKADHQTKLLRNVLFFKYFIQLDKTKIFPEGLTDIAYLQADAEALEKKNDYSFQRINASLGKLGITGGTPPINTFINYLGNKDFLTLEQFQVQSNYPAIFILDYDQGLKDKANITSKFDKHKGKQYIHIDRNIYILLLEKYNADYGESAKAICIENLIQYNGSPISTAGEKNEDIKWNERIMSKMEFSKIVFEKPKSFDFTRFSHVFELISEIERDYAEKMQLWGKLDQQQA